MWSDPCQCLSCDEDLKSIQYREWNTLDSWWTLVEINTMPHCRGLSCGWTQDSHTRGGEINMNPNDQNIKKQVIHLKTKKKNNITKHSRVSFMYLLYKIHSGGALWYCDLQQSWLQRGSYQARNHLIASDSNFEKKGELRQRGKEENCGLHWRKSRERCLKNRRQ